jgi:hypothetical protein
MSPRLLRPRASGVHPEAASWRTRVVANGGSVSSTTMRAVDAFCRSIDATSGLRACFYRLNLFCGNSDGSLNAVRTPLYRGPALGGATFGGSADTVNNFIESDYSESSGLKGNPSGSGKWLATGLKPADTGGGLHMAFSLQSDAAVNEYQIGCDNFNDSGWTACSMEFVNAAQAVGGATGLRGRGTTSSNSGAVGSSILTSSSVLRFLVSSPRTLGSGQSIYENGSLSETRSPTYATHPDFPITVFALNRKGTTVARSSARLSSYSIGLDMTAPQAASYNTALVAFLQALGRPTA